MTIIRFGKFFCSLIIVLLFATNGSADVIEQNESDTARILMLEKALAPDTAEAAASLFAQANKERNGAVQFMLFSPALKIKYKDYGPYWVSGTSSPWITSFTIKKTVLKKDKWQFEITYKWATSEGPFLPDLVQTIIIESVPENENSSQGFWITKFAEN